MVLVGRQRQQREAEQRAEHRAAGVHRAVHAEGGAELVLRAAERDHRVARGGPDALADPVDEQHGGQAAEGGGRQQAELADRREAVAEPRDLAVAAHAVGDEAEDQPREGRAALVDAVQDAVLQRVQAEDLDGVERQDRRHHLGGDVGEKAGQTEQQHRSSDERAAGLTGGGKAAAGAQERDGILDLVHGERRGGDRLPGTVNAAARKAGLADRAGPADGPNRRGGWTFCPGPGRRAGRRVARVIRSGPKSAHESRVMSDPGPAQLDLIRRYARTMRAMQADAVSARGPRIGAREARDRRQPIRCPRANAPLSGRPPGSRRERRRVHAAGL